MTIEQMNAAGLTSQTADDEAFDTEFREALDSLDSALSSPEVHLGTDAWLRAVSFMGLDEDEQARLRAYLDNNHEDRSRHTETWRAVRRDYDKLQQLVRFQEVLVEHDKEFVGATPGEIGQRRLGGLYKHVSFNYLSHCSTDVFAAHRLRLKATVHGPATFVAALGQFKDTQTREIPLALIAKALTSAVALATGADLTVLLGLGVLNVALQKLVERGGPLLEKAPEKFTYELERNGCALTVDDGTKFTLKITDPNACPGSPLEFLFRLPLPQQASQVEPEASLEEAWSNCSIEVTPYFQVQLLRERVGDWEFAKFLIARLVESFAKREFQGDTITIHVAPLRVVKPLAGDS